jgi:hypothetical protein
MWIWQFLPAADRRIAKKLDVSLLFGHNLELFFFLSKIKWSSSLAWGGLVSMGN